MQERGSRAPLIRDRRGGTLLLLAVAAAVVAVDQLTKWWAINALDDRDIDLVWTLRLSLTFNRGGAFGLGEEFGPVLPLVGVVVVLLLVKTGRLVSGRGVDLALGLVLGGALGNIVDRAFREGSGFLGGAVVDFIDLQWWPVFNVADMAIVVGAVLLVVVGQGTPDRQPA